MANPPFPYKRVLLVGATSGIGKAMAERLVRAGVKVIAVGRRKDRLDAFVAAHNEDKASSAVFDIGDTEKIPTFVANIAKTYPDLDCVFLNAGVQFRHDFSKPGTIDLKRFNNEMHVNYTSFVALTHGFLPLLLSKPKASVIYTTSNLAIVPAAPLPSYSASKAALNAFILCLREQLRESTVKVVELSPPVVQTELHDAEMGEEAGRKFGMPVEAFTDQAYAELAAGKDQVVIGSLFGQPEGALEAIIKQRRTAFEALSQMMRKRL